MKRILLSEIITAINAQADKDYAGIEVGGVSTDTRSLITGDVFFAIEGDNFDGHDYIGMAEGKGACAVVASKKIEASVPVLYVGDTVKALQELAGWYRSTFAIPVIAVTGSNGKTTTKNMISAILSGRYKVFATDKNYNNEIGLPKSILELDDTYDAAVFEIGMNHIGEIKRLSDIARPDIAVITNIGSAHIGLLGSKENVFAAKMEIVSGLKAGGTLILNADDGMLKNVVLKEHRTVFAGTGDTGVGALYATGIETDASQTRFLLHDRTRTYPCRLPALGKHNVINALLAVCCAQMLGVGMSDALEELGRYTVSPMRCEVSYVKGIAVIRDYYNSSPESAEAALRVLANYTAAGKKIAVLGEMSELGAYAKDEHLKLARLCAKLGLDYVFFIGAEHEVFCEGIGRNGECCGDGERNKLKRALKRYVTGGSLGEGDVVLIKGSRVMRMEEFYEALKTYINAEKSDFVSLPPSPTKLYVDIGAVKHNYRQIKKAVGNKVEIMPMVKANAYGCGTDIIANIFRDSKYLAVADVKEAALVRRILSDANIVIIYQPYEGDIEEIVACGYIPAVSNPDFCFKLNEEAKSQDKTVKIHIEIDTGHARLGLKPEKCTAFAERLGRLSNIETDGIFMHYSSADSFDEDDIEFTRHQTELFVKAVSDCERVLGKIPYRHACAGAAIFNQAAAHFDMVRPGYLLYGYYPGDALKDKVLLKPSLKFVSVILQISEHEAGTPVSYNRRFTTSRKSRIATVAVGYSDGVSRRLFRPDNKKNGCFVVNGQRAPVVGMICMDLTMLDITDISGPVGVGDEVAIFDNVNVTVEEMAEICDTIGYEIISQLEDKADRVESF